MNGKASSQENGTSQLIRPTGTLQGSQAVKGSGQYSNGDNNMVTQSVAQVNTWRVEVVSICPVHGGRLRAMVEVRINNAPKSVNVCLRSSHFWGDTPCTLEHNLCGDNFWAGAHPGKKFNVRMRDAKPEDRWNKTFYTDDAALKAAIEQAVLSVWNTVPSARPAHLQTDGVCCANAARAFLNLERGR